jgi:hypothetical protein
MKSRLWAGDFHRDLRGIKESHHADRDNSPLGLIDLVAVFVETAAILVLYIYKLRQMAVSLYRRSIIAAESTAGFREWKLSRAFG